MLLCHSSVRVGRPRRRAASWPARQTQAGVLTGPAGAQEALPELFDKLVLIGGECQPASGEQIMQGRRCLLRLAPRCAAGRRTQGPRCCAEYGFRNVRSLDSYGACHPYLVPHKAYPAVGAAERAWADQPVAAIALIEMSRDWHADLQLCLDLLRWVLHARSCPHAGPCRRSLRRLPPPALPMQPARLPHLRTRASNQLSCAGARG